MDLSGQMGSRKIQPGEIGTVDFTRTADSGNAAQDVATRAACLANWPDAWNGDYNPRCCRFPKSCSVPSAAD